MELLEKDKKELCAKARDNFIEHREDLLTEDDQKYFEENLMELNDWDSINDKELLKGKSEKEVKIIHRLNDKNTKYCKRAQ